MYMENETRSLRENVETNGTCTTIRYGRNENEFQNNRQDSLSSKLLIIDSLKALRSE